MAARDLALSAGKPDGAEALPEDAMRCPICSAPARLYYRHPDALLYECPGCSHVFPDLSSVRIHEAYGEDYFEVEHKNWLAHPNLRLWEWVLDQIPADATSLLDVGCGDGGFLRFVRARRPELALSGIDIACPAKEGDGITLLKDDFLRSPRLGVYDVVVSLAVIEHVHDVNAYLRRIGEVLRAGGRFVALTIDNSSVLYRMARVASRCGIHVAATRLYSVHHLHHFTPKSLRLVLKNHHFEVLSRISHNAPLRAIDLPTNNRLLRRLLMAAVGMAFGLGRLTGMGFLQTVCCQKVR